MTSEITCVVVLAAGQGKRMKSTLPKVLHPVLGRPMLLWVLEAARAVHTGRTVVVLGHGHEQVRPHLSEEVEVALQECQLGTGHALLAAADRLPPGPILVLPGDTPLVTGEVLRQLVDDHYRTGATATVLTMELEDPSGYGRVVRAADGSVRSIVEHRDATPEELSLREVNSSMYVLPIPEALEILADVGSDNDQREIYLTDVIAGLCARGRRVEASKVSDPTCVLGVNSREELCAAEDLMRPRRSRPLGCAPSATARQSAPNSGTVLDG